MVGGRWNPNPLMGSSHIIKPIYDLGACVSSEPASSTGSRIRWGREKRMVTAFWMVPIVAALVLVFGFLLSLSCVLGKCEIEKEKKST